MIINTNLSSVNTNRVSKFQQVETDTRFRNLSSGKRINRAGDDASGMAVTDRMTGQILGLNRAEKNAMDGISMIQTTEGYAKQTTSVLNRLREMSVQASNGIYSDQDRLYIQVELSQLVAEVDRVAYYAQFNGLNLLTGRFSNPVLGGIPTASMWFHVGANADQRIQAYIGTLTTLGLNLTDAQGNIAISVSAPGKANDTLRVVDQSLQKVHKQLADLGAYQNRLEYVSRSLAIASENTQAARSRIRDANMAEEVSKLTTSQILSQSQIAVLAQSNQRAQSVLRLLQ